jgi:hypothetical protein
MSVIREINIEDDELIKARKRCIIERENKERETVTKFVMNVSNLPCDFVNITHTIYDTFTSAWPDLHFNKDTIIDENTKNINSKIFNINNLNEFKEFYKKILPCFLGYIIDYGWKIKKREKLSSGCRVLHLSLSSETSVAARIYYPSRKGPVSLNEEEDEAIWIKICNDNSKAEVGISINLDRYSLAAKTRMKLIRHFVPHEWRYLNPTNVSTEFIENHVENRIWQLCQLLNKKID